MENQTLEVAAKKVAEWWAEKRFNTALNQNNGDDSENGGMAFMLMNMVSMNAKKTITTDQQEAFKKKLVELILGSDYPYQSLHVDYNPDRLLSDACSFAGIDASCMPCKSSTWIDRETNKVTASFGYHGERVVI